MAIREMILEGKHLLDVDEITELKEKYGTWCRKVAAASEECLAEKEQAELKVKMLYTENEYSADSTRKSIKKALGNTLSFLERKSDGQQPEHSKDIALVERMLEHFYMYYFAMYKSPVHKSGTLAQKDLDAISIGNEYDLQRMLYALLLPAFPTARTEVNSDNGYGGMRADIYLEECDLIIEAKCTRESMSEKKLLEELGADAFHYQAKAVFFFIYDKNGIIKNPEAFKKAFSREEKTDGKRIKAFLLQSMKL